MVEGYSESDLDAAIDYSTMTRGPGRDRRADIIQHLFNHQTHHRGQAHSLPVAIAPGGGAAVAGLDLFSQFPGLEMRAAVFACAGLQGAIFLMMLGTGAVHPYGCGGPTAWPRALPWSPRLVLAVSGGPALILAGVEQGAGLCPGLEPAALALPLRPIGLRLSADRVRGRAGGHTRQGRNGDAARSPGRSPRTGQ